VKSLSKTQNMAVSVCVMQVAHRNENKKTKQVRVSTVWRPTDQSSTQWTSKFTFLRLSARV
jgi:hypothetical protein